MKRTHFVKGFSVVACGVVCAVAGLWACGMPSHIVESSPSRNATTCEWTLSQVSNDSVGSWESTGLYLPMDVNGDKKTDLVVIWDNAGQATARVSPSNGTAFVQSSNAAVGGWAPSTTTYLPMDVNGDGKADLVVVWDNGGTQTAQVSLSNGTAFGQVSNAALGSYLSSAIDLPMDVNGDGKADLVVLWDDSGVATAQVNVSNGTAFSQASNAAVGTWNSAGYNLVGDVNGDGKADLVRILPSGSNAVAEVWLSTGTGFSQASANVVGGWPSTGVNPNVYRLADVNGDGKADLVILWPNGANTDAQVSISNGTAFSQVSNDSLGPTVAQTQTLFEDVNGDGKIDLVQVYPSGTTTEAQVWVSNGTSFVSNSITAQGSWVSSSIDLPMAVSGAGAGGLVVLWQDTTQPVSAQATALISVPACSGSSSGSGTTTGGTGSGSTTSGSSSGADAGVLDAGPTVVIAVAGDISDPALDDQVTTSDLVLAGHYDAVLTLGDNQYNSGSGTEFFDYFGPTWGRFKANIFPALGNHEYGSNPPASGYFDYFFNPDAGNNNPRITDPGASDPARGYYSYDLGAWHLIALNTNTAASENDACSVVACNAGSAQEVWLKNDLATHKQRCTLAYWHQARFTAGGHTDDADLQALWDDLYAADADVILNGHDHNYQRFVPMGPDGGPDPARGIVEFIVGTGGTTIVYNTNSDPKTLATHENGTFGVLKLTLRPTGYDYEFLPTGVRDGGVIGDGGLYTDKGSGECH